MKFYNNALLLALLGGATAFAPKALKPTSTALNSSPLGMPGGPQQSPYFGASTGPPNTAPGYLAQSGSPSPAGGLATKGNVSLVKDVWETSVAQELVQGGSLRTWSFTTNAIERVGVFMKTDGRPLNANVELWQGPDYTPLKLDIYIEDGNVRPFTAVLETPGAQNSIAIRNIGKMEFPLSAALEAEVEDDVAKGGDRLDAVIAKLAANSSPKTVQGGAIHTYPFSPSVASVQVLLKTDGRPLNARIELLQGPNNKKEVIDIHSEDGMERPLFMILEAPGSGNVVRIINTATLEFPISACVEPFTTEEFADESGSGSNYFIVD